MASQLPVVQTFPFDSNAVRAQVDPKGAPWFCAKDVCAALEISDHKQAARGLEDDERGVFTTPSPGGQQEAVFVSESGLYALIFQSRKPVAKAFRKWVTNEVLPALRRGGFYGQITSGERLRASAQAVVVARYLATAQDAFLKRYLSDRLADLSTMLGQTLPDVSLLGQKTPAVSSGAAS